MLLLSRGAPFLTSPHLLLSFLPAFLCVVSIVWVVLVVVAVVVIIVVVAVVVLLLLLLFWHHAFLFVFF